jgi:mannose-6-phosphate isomerase-like protein (cupin superfamily)
MKEIYKEKEEQKKIEKAVESGEVCKISGKDANEVIKIFKDFDNLKEKDYLKGNLNDPSFIISRPGKKLHFPINIFNIPHRRANYALAVIEPGGGWPEEVHETVDDVYLVLKGKGKVELDGKIFDANEMDVFHITSGTHHRLYNPKNNKEDLHVWLVETPATPLDIKVKEWNLSI